MFTVQGATCQNVSNNTITPKVTFKRINYYFNKQVTGL